MRDVFGFICLGLLVLALVALVVGLVRPALLARLLRRDPGAGPPSRRPVWLALGPLSAGLAVLVYGLLLAPTYDVALEPQEQIVAAPGSAFAALVDNEGALSGTYREVPELDGTALPEAVVEVAGGATGTVVIALPDDLSAGEHTLALGDATVAFKALTPPDYRVGKLKVEPAVAAVKDPVDVSVMVENRGEATGTYPGVLEMNGKEAATDETEIPGGESRLVSWTLQESTPHACRLSVEGKKAEVVYVRPVRLATGTVLANKLSGGDGKLVLKNGYPEDCMFCLTLSKSAETPSLAVYVRGKQKATVSGLKDGRYYVFYCFGDDWNRHTKDFLDDDGHGRFEKPVAFVTKNWTSRYTDWDAWTIWTTYHTQYTLFTIEISPKYGDKEGGVMVEAEDFPDPI